jgi:FkbM family methyltransferase
MNKLHRCIASLKFEALRKIFKHNPIVLIDLLEFPMYIDLATPGISKVLYIDKVREQDMIKLIKEYINAADGDVIDCGSNMGFYPLLIDRLIGSHRKLIMIEPDPRNYKVLSKNIALMKSDDNRITLNAAISDFDGEVTLDVSTASNLNKVVRDSMRGFSVNENRINVRSFSLDSIVDTYKLRPTFLRMDIEGHEVEVLRGMRKTIKSAAPGFVIFFEIHPKEYTVDRSIIEQLEFLFINGFDAKVLVSAGEVRPQKYIDLGLYPDDVIETDGYTRGIYRNVTNSEAAALVSSTPKSSRYILLQKRSY